VTGVKLVWLAEKTVVRDLCARQESSRCVGTRVQGTRQVSQRQFQHDEPDQAWVTDITYIRTHEGWLYLAAVLDLHSRAMVGWSMGSRMQTGLVLDALTMAVWRSRPKDSVIIHSD
jgi:putative transposase